MFVQMALSLRCVLAASREPSNLRVCMAPLLPGCLPARRSGRTQGEYEPLLPRRFSPPIVKAYSINPPAPVHVETAAEAVCGHSVLVTQLREDGDTAWRAKVAGEKAAKSCPRRGYKTIYAPDEVQLKERVRQWLEEEV